MLLVEIFRAGNLKRQAEMADAARASSAGLVDLLRGRKPTYRAAVRDLADDAANQTIEGE
jgi:hypothetical protein